MSHIIYVTRVTFGYAQLHSFIEADASFVHLRVALIFVAQSPDI